MATIDEVAAYLKLSPRTLHDQRHRGVEIGALAIKVGKHLRWRWADIDAYFAGQSKSA